MGGTNSGSSQHNSSSSSGSINTSSATMGRERAIDALIDREPQGDYYRAARVIVRCYVVSACECNIFWLTYVCSHTFFATLLSHIIGRSCSDCSSESTKFDHQVGIN